MDLEQIERKMFGSKIQCLFDISLPAFKSLTGQSCDQVKTYIRKIRIAQISKSSQRVCCVVRSAQLCEFRVVESLCAKAGPVNSETPKRVQLLRSRTSRIYLEGDFCSRGDLKLVI